MSEAIGYILLLLGLGIASFLWILVMVVVCREFSRRAFPKGLGEWQEGVKFLSTPRDSTLSRCDDRDGQNPRIGTAEVRTAFRRTLILLALFTMWFLVNRYVIQ